MSQEFRSQVPRAQVARRGTSLQNSQKLRANAVCGSWSIGHWALLPLSPNKEYIGESGRHKSSCCQSSLAFQPDECHVHSHWGKPITSWGKSNHYMAPIIGACIQFVSGYSTVQIILLSTTKKRMWYAPCEQRPERPGPTVGFMR